MFIAVITNLVHSYRKGVNFMFSTWFDWSSRVKNGGFWVSLVALVLMVLRAFKVSWLNVGYDELTTVVLAVLTFLGVLSNPTEGNWYVDTKEEAVYKG
ncbi:MAG: hypothetical protein RLZ12_376 [Bacillota bacterium]|jgi:uncharacterized membrane protein